MSDTAEPIALTTDSSVRVHGVAHGGVSIVAGGGSGIGRATAQACAREGGQVMVADRSGAEREVADLIGDAACSARTDMTDPGSVEALVRETLERFGRLDALINCVGVCDAFDRIVDLDPQEFDRLVAANLRSAFLGIKFAVPPMIDQRRGSIVNVASAGGISATAGLAAYGAAKAGVIMLTKTAALEYGLQGVRVNAICPGPILTPILEAVPSPGLVQQALVASIPMGRLGEASEVAELAVFLSSDRASFISGAAIPIDGGRLVSADSRGAEFDPASS